MVEILIHNWAIAAAGLLALAILLFVIVRGFSDSARGRLRTRVQDVRQRSREVVRAQRVLAAAVERLEKLQRRADAVKPRRIQEAVDAVEDAKMLFRVANDQVLIAENHVRKLIFEEFPPRRQEALRRKFLQRPRADDKPFTF